jgi:hypothetical protein
MGDRPLPVLPGWKPERVFLDDSLPINFLVLLHENGQEAVWFLDNEMAYIGNDVAALPVEIRLAVESRLGAGLAAPDEASSKSAATAAYADDQSVSH